jgi:DNA helicase-2/ATP-dependent DNA helicase PcrA
MGAMSRDYVLQTSRPAVELHIDYARELNPQQLAAVTAPPGPALVIAGAGAGKTRTLVYRVAYLLEHGVPPENILLLTFTNKAAREMMRRVTELLGQDLSRLWGGTFHALGNRVLRRHADALGYRQDFTILDREDARDLAAACLGEADIDVKARRFPKADVLCDLFSLAVNTAQHLPQLLERQFPWFLPFSSEIETLQQAYAERKRASNGMDFDDLLVLWLRLLEQQPEVRAHYQRRFEYVLVDEYQDTNQLQSDLVDLLAAVHHNVMAVGDDSQSIYSWRGANFRNIMRFPDRHPGATLYRIEVNYRSTPEILTVANAAIAANVHQYEKRLAPVRPAGPKPSVVPCPDANAQAAFVAQRVLELREEGTPLHEIAVLYRSHFHALELQMELTQRQIPFSITSGIRFFEQAHVKDVAAYLRLVCNPRDELAFKRLVKLLPGIGPKAADKLWTALKPQTTAAGQVGVAPGDLLAGTGAGRDPDSEEDATMPAATEVAVAEVAVADLWNPEAEDAPPVPPPFPLATALQSLSPLVPRKTQTAWAQFTATISQLETGSTRSSSPAMIKLVLEAVYEDYLQATYTNAAARLEDLEQLGSFAQRFASPEVFLAELALLTNVELEAESARAAEDERLRLSTIHQAKGLEFGVVFVIMLCDGLFPSARSIEDADNAEEERRLFYVAVTRAKNELYLSYPLFRAVGANLEGCYQSRSRFLSEIPGDLLDEWNLRLTGVF